MMERTGGSRSLCAVVIGANQALHARHHPLRFAEADAMRFAASLRSQDFYEQMELTTFVGGSFSRAEVLATISSTASESAVLIFFAGHGIVEIASELETLYLSVPTVDLDDVSGTGIDLHSLIRELDEREPVTVILDCCFSGHDGGRSILGRNYLARRTDGRSVARRSMPQFVGEGNVVLAACGRDQSALESAALGHGVYTYALCQALMSTKDAAIPVIQAHARAQAHVIELTSGRQCPSLHGRDMGGLLPSFLPQESPT
jgi:hypothetical protein